jgi:hypothetical protein
VQASTLLDGPLNFSTKPGNPEVSAKQPRYVNPKVVPVTSVGVVVGVEAWLVDVALLLEVEVEVEVEFW